MSSTSDKRPENGAASHRWSVNDPRSYDRAQGCLLGQLAGDSLGALVEFQSKADIACRYPQGLYALDAGGPWRIVAGQPTDDSEMALTLARTLVRDRGLQPERVFEAYVRWSRSKPFDIGNTTSTALSESLYQGRGRAHQSQANGSLMRVSPVGIFAAGDPERAAALARVDSELTHPHPLCMSACAAFAAAIAVGITGGSRRAMFEAAVAWAGQGDEADTIRTVLHVSVEAAPHEFQSQMGWVLIALQNAFYHLSIGHDLRSSVGLTVMQGGDTDTNGAIVGALIGAAEGRSRAQDDWEVVISACRPSVASAAPNPRPEEYWPCDFLDLALQVITAGASRG